MEIKFIGEFEVKSGKMLVADPGSNIGTSCAGTLENVRNGIYYAAVLHNDFSDCNMRNYSLIIIHSSLVQTPDNFDYVYAVLDKHSFKATDFDIIVDSGQAGFFDLAAFRQDSIITEDTPICNEIPVSGEAGERFYSACCYQTQKTEINAGVIPCGAVSTSGSGNGVYACFVAGNDENELFAAALKFISKADDSEQYSN